MRRFDVALAVAALGLALAGCGHNIEERAATGAGVGLVIAGPVGAAVGAGVGAVVSKSNDKGAPHSTPSTGTKKKK